jgi:hypothetical protein
LFYQQQRMLESTAALVAAMNELGCNIVPLQEAF